MFATDTELERLTAEGHALPETDRHVLPENLEDIGPGLFLAAVLDSVDRSRLSGHDTVRVLQADARMEAHYASRKYVSMVEVAHRTDPDAGTTAEMVEYASDEIGAALTLTRRAAESELEFAAELDQRFPDVGEALSSGVIDVRRARVLVDNVGHLDSDTATTVVATALTEAPQLTTGQLRARIQKLCIEADTDQAKRRYEDRLAERKVVARINPEGTANLYGLDLAPNKVAAIRGRIQGMALRLKAGGDPRKMDQLRADIFEDLLLGKRPVKTAKKSSGNRKKMDGGGTITMHATLETLAGLSEQTADIPGLGPVIADAARQVIEDHPNAEYRYKITAPNGDVIIGTPSRHATKALRRLVELRDETCVEPGCRVPAEDCDIDHIQRHVDGGPTNDQNSAPLCRHGHMVEDTGRWKLTRNPDGSYTWTTPLGHTYTIRPPP